MLTKLLSHFGYRVVKVSEEPREIVRAFAMEMEGRLRENSHKDTYVYATKRFGPGWRFKTKAALENRAWNDVNKVITSEQPEDIREHCVDAACHLMMLADEHGELLPRESCLR